MAVKKVKDVLVGSILQAGGGVYKVTGNTGNDLKVVKQVFKGAFEYNESLLSTVLGRTLGAESVLFLDSEPSQATSLTESLRAQVKQNALTESLKAQVAEQDEDDEEDEEDEDEGYEYRPDPNPFRATGLAPTFTTAYAAPLEFKGEAKDETARQSALTANLRAQKAESGAVKASLKATGAVNKVEALEKDTRAAFDTVKSDLQTVVAQTNRAFGHVTDDIEAVIDDVEGLEARVAKIENNKKQEELKMNLQQQLNNKLEVQSKLNKSLEAHKKPAGVKGLLGSFKGAFGKVEGKFAFSPITGGLAIRKGNTGEFVAFDGKEITDVNGLTLDIKVPAFRLPVTADQVKKGDIVLNNNDYGYVTEVADGYVQVVNVEKNTRGSVLPTKNVLLNGSFFTVVKTLDTAGQGGFDPTLLLLLGKEDSSSEDLLPFLLMSGGLQGGAAQGAINPMMLLALKDSAEDLLPFLLMQQGGVLGGEGFNPLMLLAMDGKGGDMKDILMIQALSGQQGGLFGQQVAKVEASATKVEAKQDKK